MEPIEMPDSWHSQFVGIKLYTGYCFRISKTALTDNILQVATYAIDMDDGVVLKHRYGATGHSDEPYREGAKNWPVLHKRRFGGGIVAALERAGAFGSLEASEETPDPEWVPEEQTEMRNPCSEVAYTTASTPSPSYYSYETTCVQLSGTDGIS